MRPLLLILSLVACSSDDKPKAAGPAAGPVGTTPVLAPEAPATPAAHRLETSSGSVAWRLLDHLAEGRFEFPATTATSAFEGSFTLDKGWSDEGVRKGGGHAYAATLPFRSTMPRPNFAPMGARLFRGAEEIPFDASVGGGAAEDRRRWWVDHGRVMVVSPDDPSSWAEPPVLKVPELAAAFKALSFSASGRTPTEFARTSQTEERVTRPALYLPAPASAEFTVPVPATGKLRFGLALAADPITGEAVGDGADVEVFLDGASIWKGHAGPEHAAVDVELPAGAARTGTLRLTTAPGSTNEGDYVVVTAPYLAAGGAPPPRRIVVIGVDTLRWDALSANGATRPTSPDLDSWLAQSVQFTNAYAPAPRTKPSFRTAFSGTYPSAVDPTNVAEVLSARGFSTAGVSGNVHLVPRFGFNRGMDHWEYENGAKADQQVDRALAWAEAHKDEDSFLFVHIMDPHTHYDAPAPYRGSFQEGRNRPKGIPAKFNRWNIWSLMKRQKLTDEGKTWIRAAYDEEVAFATHEIARLYKALDALPGDTLIVLHTDHGEEFWDHDGYEHNHSLYDELVHAVLAIRPPKGWKDAPKVDANVGLVDIAATLYDFAGVPAEARPKSDGVSLRSLVDPAKATEAAALREQLFGRPLLVGHLRYNRDRWGVVYQKYKYILQTGTGVEELYDLEADPAESKNLAPEADAASLAAMRVALERASGWPTRPGFRVRIPSAVSTTKVTFEAPILSASVMDPELMETVRANQEWGEKPKKLPEDVGTVTLSPDRKSFVFNPGARASGGTLLVQCEADPCPAGTLSMGKITTPFKGDRGVGGTLYAIEPGTVLVPHDRSDLPAEGEVGATEREQLESLGYLQDEGDDKE